MRTWLRFYIISYFLIINNLLYIFYFSPFIFPSVYSFTIYQEKYENLSPLAYQL